MIGRSLLHYTITVELGAGGMGRVFLARDTRTDRQVALKLVGEGAVGPEARERLEREARAAARLSHPGIVTLHALEEAEGELFLVQEFVEGESLTQRLARGPLGPQEALRLARELTAALAHAHDHGVLHRDLKPDNVLIGTDGRYRIADFGIARLSGTPTLTQAGVVMGSLPYMAPERLRGHAGDARADLFALGAILYEALAGRRAFPGAGEAEVMYAAMNEDPAPLEARGAVAAGLGELAQRLLAKEPTQRPPSAEAVAGTLEGLEVTRTIASAPPARRARPRWLIPAAAGVALALIAGAVWWSRTQVAEASGPAVAVLAFDNVADPADPQRLGTIAGNLLVTSLAQVSELNVLSPQRMMDALGGGRAADRSTALRAARQAGATRIVTGSVLQTEPTIVMTAEVADVRSGKVLHAERIEGQPRQTVFQVVDALSARLLDRMKAPTESIRLQPVAQRSSADLEAQRQYALGLEALSGGRTYDAMRAFAEAVRRDTSFAQAHYQLGIAQWWQFEPASAAASLARARRHAARLSPTEHGALEGLTLLVDQRWSQAAAAFQALAERYPNDKLVLYGWVEGAYHGERWEDAIAAARRVLELDPRFTIAGVHLADALRETRRLDEAETTARALVRREPRNSMVWQSLFTIMLARGDAQGALAVADSARVRGALQNTLPFQAGLLELNLRGRAAVMKWLPPDTLPAWVRREAMVSLDYADAMLHGRFRDALAMAERAWRLVPPATAAGSVGLPGPSLPGADGINAAIALRDTGRALGWADTVLARLSIWDPVNGTLGGLGFKLEVLQQLGMTSRMPPVLRSLEAQPRAGEHPERLRFARARLAEAQGRPQVALSLLRGAHYPGPPWLKGMLGYARARNLIAAGRPAEALVVIDTLLRVPMLPGEDMVRLHLHRGRALERLGRGADAAAAYRELLRLWKEAPPGTREVVEGRAALARLGRSGPRAARTGA